MSDGIWTYPSEAIKKIQQSRVMSKLLFRGIGYGKDPRLETVMKPMAKDLNGTMVIELEPEALT